MILKSIKPSRSPERVNLNFSPDLVLPLAVEDIYLLSLHRNQDLDEAAFAKILHRSLYFLLYNYSLRQVAMSPKNEHVLSTKMTVYLPRLIYRYGLQSYSYDQELLKSQVLTKLKARNLIDDSEFARSYIRRKSQKSKRQLVFELQRQGVSQDLINQHLSESVGDRDKIIKRLIKKQVTPQKLIDFSYKNKIMASLARQGFSYDDIMSAIDDLAKKK